VIGSGTTIGANVFLMESVAPGSLVRNERALVNIVSKKDRQTNDGRRRYPEMEPLLNDEI